MSSSKFIICFAALLLLPLLVLLLMLAEEIVSACPSKVFHQQNLYCNKRAKLNLDSTLLWHYRPRHINKKHIKKLQHDGLSKSTDDESFDKCVSCLSSKMARNRFPHQVERVNDLLGLIHIDEVQNQLRKPIKALRSDHGGEFTSQEFLDHLKEHGIVSQCTPPYTLQHNGVSRRINRTLLDMVCSMMSQTTLPKSFWDYALESAIRILNMILTKKVEKTSYEDTQRKRWVTPSTIVESDITP
ncbi:zinc finger, CCHC-type containing protein [Tanacetum coccineum]